VFREKVTYAIRNTQYEKKGATMIKGLYSAVSAMIMNAARQQTLSHNISNIQTPGFKSILTVAQDWLQNQSVYTNEYTTSDGSIDYIGLLGLGTQPGEDFINFEQGSLEATGNPLDFAIQGDGFFSVNTPDGQRYTRDGRFLRDADNTLVTVDGYQVLDDTGQPITLPDGDVSITADGTLNVNNTEVATLFIGVFADPAAELEHVDGNLFTGPAASTGDTQPQVVQGYVEASNANAAQLMTQMVEVARSYEAAQNLVRNQDELLGKTISSLGRIG
jgi:flagellar basal-body rod protein FlgF